MGTSKPIIFLLLLILGALCTEDSCPVKLSDRPKIASGTTTITQIKLAFNPKVQAQLKPAILTTLMRINKILDLHHIPH